LSANHFYAAGSYKVTAPKGKVYGPTKGRYWSLTEENFHALDADKRLWWGKNQNGRPRRKVFETETDPEAVPNTIWPAFEVGDNQEATKEVRALGFADASKHSPKPVRLIERCIELICQPNENALILDPFAGTGTTGHAVLALNEGDAGNRRFILIEHGNDGGDPYCRTLTAERVKRAIDQNGYPEGFTFLATGGTMDRRAIVGLICQADETGRGRGITRLSGYQYIIGKNSRNEAICLVWNGEDNSEVTKEDYRKAAEEVKAAGLKKPLRMYGGFTYVGDTASWVFRQIPDEILAQMHIQEDWDDTEDGD